MSRWFKSEWFKGFISGVLAILIGFLLVVCWDLAKSRRESLQRDKAVLSAVKQELLANLSMLEEHRKLIQADLALIKQRRLIVAPLILLETGSWDLLRVNIPRDVANRPEILVQIRQAAELTERVNEIIRSRETYRLHNQAMTDFYSYMNVYDQILSEQFEELVKLLRELATKL